MFKLNKEGDDEMPIGASFDFINRKDFEVIELKCPLSYNFIDEVENISNEYIIQCKSQLYVLSFVRKLFYWQCCRIP